MAHYLVGKKNKENQGLGCNILEFITIPNVLNFTQDSMRPLSSGTACTVMLSGFFLASFATLTTKTKKHTHKKSYDSIV